MRVLLTGSEGFLGWHTRSRLRALTGHQVIAVGRPDWSQLPELVKDVDAVIHLAGVNRGTPSQVETGNVQLAQDITGALRACDRRLTIVFANSIHSGCDTPYGQGKAGAASILAREADSLQSNFIDIKLPNLFGEHGRPGYNSFVASFTEGVINGTTPHIIDRRISLLHVQDAAQLLLDAVENDLSSTVCPVGTSTSVSDVLNKLQRFNGLYLTGDIPPLITDFDVDLFNTLRAARFPHHYPIPLAKRIDERGRLIEVVRSHGGQGQTFVSTSAPGVTRGDHFHIRKVERFVVLSGQARISLRRLFTNEVISFDVGGENPVIVDMPTLWAHNITNTGSSELTTVFWTHVLFDQDAPDTFPEPVDPISPALTEGQSSAPQLRDPLRHEKVMGNDERC